MTKTVAAGNRPRPEHRSGVHGHRRHRPDVIGPELGSELGLRRYLALGKHGSMSIPRSLGRNAVCLALLLFAVGCDSLGVVYVGPVPDAQIPTDGGTNPIPDGGLEPDGGPAQQGPVSIVVLPDTQYYSDVPSQFFVVDGSPDQFPGVFGQQTAWIVAQKSALNIAAVLHVGDLVQYDETSDWTVANPAMRVLDNVVPYVIVPGNHDYSDDSRATKIDNYFSPASMPWITGTMDAGKIENSYALIDIGAQKWLVLGLEFAPRDVVLTWADAVLKRYAAYPAMILTHAYLYSDGTRYDFAAGGNDADAGTYQWFYPQSYKFTPGEGSNDGEMMWQKLILPNSNVRLVFCGHQTGGAFSTSTRPDGTTVHQMLSDYQWLDQDWFGFGYLRIVQFDYAKKTIQVQTFSPFCTGDASTCDNANFPNTPCCAVLPDDQSDPSAKDNPASFTLDLNL